MYVDELADRIIANGDILDLQFDRSSSGLPSYDMLIKHDGKMFLCSVERVTGFIGASMRCYDAATTEQVHDNPFSGAVRIGRVPGYNDSPQRIESGPLKGAIVRDD